MRINVIRNIILGLLGLIAVDLVYLQVIRGDDFRGRMLNEGMFAAGSTPEEFGRFLTTESNRWGPLLRRLDLQAG